MTCGFGVFHYLTWLVSILNHYHRCETLVFFHSIWCVNLHEIYDFLVHNVCFRKLEELLAGALFKPSSNELASKFFCIAILSGPLFFHYIDATNVRYICR